LVYSLPGELFSCLAFPSDILLLGSQSGAIYQYKYPNPYPIRSVNYNQNFYTTSISALTPSLFAFGTSDGFVQIYSLIPGSEGQLYSFQSINKAVRCVLWDLGTRAILYSNENEKYQVSFVHAQPSNDGYGKDGATGEGEGVIARRIIQTDAFVESIVQPAGSNWTGFLDRQGWLSGVSSPEMRRFLHRTKDTVIVEKRFRLRDVEGNVSIEIINPKDKLSVSAGQEDLGVKAEEKDPFDSANIPSCDSVMIDRDDKQLVLVLVANRSGCLAIEGWECAP